MRLPVCLSVGAGRLVRGGMAGKGGGGFGGRGVAPPVHLPTAPNNTEPTTKKTQSGHRMYTCNKLPHDPKPEVPGQLKAAIE